jgi:hypothetical protein
VSQALATTGGPIAPGASRSILLDLDPSNPNSQYLSFLSLVIPSNSDSNGRIYDNSLARVIFATLLRLIAVAGGFREALLSPARS